MRWLSRWFGGERVSEPQRDVMDRRAFVMGLACTSSGLLVPRPVMSFGTPDPLAYLFQGLEVSLCSSHVPDLGVSKEYARVSVPSDSWEEVGGSGQGWTNAEPIVFPQCTEGMHWVTHFEVLRDGASVFRQSLDGAVLLSEGTSPLFSPGHLKLAIEET